MTDDNENIDNVNIDNVNNVDNVDNDTIESLNDNHEIKSIVKNIMDKIAYKKRNKENSLKMLSELKLLLNQIVVKNNNDNEQNKEIRDFKNNEENIIEKELIEKNTDNQ